MNLNGGPRVKYISHYGGPMPRLPRKKKPTFGRWLRARLVDAELSQSDLARALGVTRQGVSLWLRDRATPSIRTYCRILAELGVDDDDALVGLHLAADDNLYSAQRVRPGAQHRSRGGHHGQGTGEGAESPV